MSNKKETKLEKENRLLLAALKAKAPDQFKDSENGDSDGEPVFAVPDETDPAVIDTQDDYNEEQDRLQVNRLDKNRFVDQQSNLLLVTNKGDTPSLQQINKSILNNDKPPTRENQSTNRRTGSGRKRKLKLYIPRTSRKLASVRKRK